MILTEYVMCNGKQKLVNELTPNCDYKVDVRCPICETPRNIYYKSIVKAGHHICNACKNKLNAKQLDIRSKFNQLTIVGHSEKSGFSICQCECGSNLIEVENYRIKSGLTKSCGCLRELNKFPILKGENHPNWKGGISDDRNRIMQTSEYKQWRKDVYERDNYTCQCCGQVGYELNAHHIQNYADNEEIRLDINNGSTLCKKCHNKFHHEHGRKNINIDILNEFINKEKYTKGLI